VRHAWTDVAGGTQLWNTMTAEVDNDDDKLRTMHGRIRSRQVPNASARSVFVPVKENKCQ